MVVQVVVKVGGEMNSFKVTATPGLPSLNASRNWALGESLGGPRHCIPETVARVTFDLDIWSHLLHNRHLTLAVSSLMLIRLSTPHTPSHSFYGVRNFDSIRERLTCVH